MDSGLKQRLVGAVVLVALAVIFLPMLLDGSGARERLNEDIAIPEQPEAPESRLQQNGSASRSGAGDDGDATTATLATDDFSGADAGGQVDTGPDPERETEPQASADAPAPEDESGSDQGSMAADAADNADADPDPGPSSGWVVQVGSFQRETNAIVLRDRLREDGFDANVEQVTGDNGTLWRVWLGPVGEREAGEALERRIEDHRGSDALLMEYSE